METIPATSPEQPPPETFKPSGLPGKLKLRVAAMLMASALGGAPQAGAAAEYQSAPTIESQEPTIEKATAEYLDVMTRGLADVYNLSPDVVRDVIDRAYQRMGSPAIYLHAIDGVRSFEGGPLKAMFIERRVFETGDPHQMLYVWCAEGAHTYQWESRPHRTAVLMGLAYGRASLQAWQEDGVSGMVNPASVQAEYDEFAYGPQKDVFSRLEQEAHGDARSQGLEGQFYDFVIQSLVDLQRR